MGEIIAFRRRSNLDLEGFALRQAAVLASCALAIPALLDVHPESSDRQRSLDAAEALIEAMQMIEEALTWLEDMAPFFLNYMDATAESIFEFECLLSKCHVQLLAVARQSVIYVSDLKLIGFEDRLRLPAA